MQNVSGENKPGGGGGGGGVVLRISGDWNDRLKFSILGFFCRKIWVA